MFTLGISFSLGLFLFCRLLLQHYPHAGEMFSAYSNTVHVINLFVLNQSTQHVVNNYGMNIRMEWIFIWKLLWTWKFVRNKLNIMLISFIWFYIVQMLNLQICYTLGFYILDTNNCKNPEGFFFTHDVFEWLQRVKETFG